MNEVTSNCFGPGGSYKMDIRNSMMVLLSHNTGTSAMTLSISGNLGADGSGLHVSSKFDSSSLTGYMTSVRGLYIMGRILLPESSQTSPDLSAQLHAAVSTGTGFVGTWY